MTVSPIPRLRPLTTPQQVREATVRDYARTAAAFGDKVTPRQIERQAVADCELADRFNAEQRTPSATEQRSRRALFRESRKAARAEGLSAAGVQVVDPLKTTPQIIRTAHMPCDRDVRWMHARGRAKRILEGVATHRDPVVACSTATCPDLALRLMRIYADFATRNVPRRPGDEANPFANLGPGDTSRVLQRLVEDVCDSSSGRMGPWLVPK